MKISYLRILYYLCKVHAFSHIFFEHFHDFKTHTYVQIKIKFSKIAFLSKYCKFDIWSYFQFSFSRLRYMNSVFFKTWSLFFFSIFEFDYIVFFFCEKRKRVSHKKNFTWKKKRFYFVILLFDVDLFEFEFIEYRMKRILS